jgi:CubicO group peptidase (beta-lactamase class C family)
MPSSRCGLVLIGLAAISFTTGVRAQVAADDEIRSILVQRIDREQQGMGIVVGVVTPSGRRVIAYGRRSATDRTPLDGDTVFEIGSVTKVFTSLLLAQEVQRGEMALTDPASKYLPEAVTLRTRHDRAITLLDLSQHTSALPPMPTNARAVGPAGSLAGYTTGQLYQFLTAFTPAWDIGSRYQYSNLGAALLAHLIERRTATDYETLVRERITAPLGMRSTAITLSRDLERGPCHRPRHNPRGITGVGSGSISWRRRPPLHHE